MALHSYKTQTPHSRSHQPPQIILPGKVSIWLMKNQELPWAHSESKIQLSAFPYIQKLTSWWYDFRDFRKQFHPDFNRFHEPDLRRERSPVFWAKTHVSLLQSPGQSTGTLPSASALGCEVTTTFASHFLNKEAVGLHHLLGQKAQNTATAEQVPFMLAQ